MAQPSPWTTGGVTYPVGCSSPCSGPSKACLLVWLVLLTQPLRAAAASDTEADAAAATLGPIFLAYVGFTVVLGLFSCC